MQRSLYLARLIGPALVVIGLGMLFNGGVYRALADEFLRSNALIYLSGLLTIVAGLALVNAHNIWEGDWRVIITILGWLGVIGGTLRILIPQGVAAIGSGMIAHPVVMPVGGILVIVLGAILSYFGYFESARAATAGRAPSRATRANAARSKRR